MPDQLRNPAEESVQTKPSCPNLNGQAMHFVLRFVRRPRLTRRSLRLPIPSFPPVALSGAGQDRLRPIQGEKICV